MTAPKPTAEDKARAWIAEIEEQARRAKDDLPMWLRTKRRVTPQGSTRLQFREPRRDAG